MANRLDLQTTLEKILGSSNVYYQPPASKTIKYPAIVYSKSNVNNTYANNATYSRYNSYEIIVIDYKPDNPVIEKLLDLPYCSFSRHYVADNLHHDALRLSKY